MNPLDSKIKIELKTLDIIIMLKSVESKAVELFVLGLKFFFLKNITMCWTNRKRRGIRKRKKGPSPHVSWVTQSWPI